MALRADPETYRLRITPAGRGAFIPLKEGLSIVCPEWSWSMHVTTHVRTGDVGYRVDALTGEQGCPCPAYLAEYFRYPDADVYVVRRI